MTVTDTPAIAEAIETSDKVASHLHPEGSYDVADHIVPTGREEIWRFTPLKRLRGLHADASFERAPPPARGTRLPVSGSRASTVTRRAPSGGSAAWCRTPGSAPGCSPRSRRPCSWTCPAEAEVAEPIIVDVTGSDASVTEAGHIALRFGNHSQAVVVLNHTGSASLAQVVEIVVGDGAHVSVVSLQDWADDAVHLTHTEALVGRDATYRHAAISFGGDVVRMDANVRYDGPGGSAEMLGLYFADDGQHIEHRLFVDHTAPNTKSHVVYKGALQGKGAHTVWIGNVLIRKIAEGIETFEENRNLVLTDGCHADSVPNLEIETGEIEGAGHASAIGRFDDEQLFYLRSRGIEEDEARRLVVHGFFNDLIRKIGVPQIEEQLFATVETELAKNVLKAAG